MKNGRMYVSILVTILIVLFSSALANADNYQLVKFKVVNVFTRENLEHAVIMIASPYGRYFTNNVGEYVYLWSGHTNLHVDFYKAGYQNRTMGFSTLAVDRPDRVPVRYFSVQLYGSGDRMGRYISPEGVQVQNGFLVLCMSDVDGHPVRDAKVVVDDNYGARLTTDENGYALLNDSPLLHRVRVIDNEFTLVDTLVDFAAIVDQESLPLYHFTMKQDIRGERWWGGNLEVEVREFGQGAPLSQAKVTLFQRDQTLQTWSDGLVAFNGLTDTTYTVLLSHDQMLVQQAMVAVEMQENPTHITLFMPPIPPEKTAVPGAAVLGRISDSAGRPLTGVRVIIGDTLSAVSDQFGRYHFPWVNPQSSEIKYYYKGSMVYRIDRLSLQDQHRSEIEVIEADIQLVGVKSTAPLQGEGVISGRVSVDLNGRTSPVMDAEVLIVAHDLDSTPYVARLITDEDGYFSQDKLPTGVFDLLVTHPSYGRISLNQLNPANSNTQLDLVLTGNTSEPVYNQRWMDLHRSRTLFSGKVLNRRSGEPVPGVMVRLRDRSGASAVTDNGGAFRISRAFPGEIPVYLEKEGFRSTLHLETIHPDTSVTKESSTLYIVPE